MDAKRIEKKIVRLIARAEELETLAKDFKLRAQAFRSQADDMRVYLDHQKETGGE